MACFTRYRIIPRLGLIREQSKPYPFGCKHWGKSKGELLMAFQMTDSQQVVVTYSAVDKKGNPVTFDAGSVVTLVDNPNILVVTTAADGLSATLAANGPLGTATVTVNGAVNGTQVSGTLGVTIVSGAPTQITITPGTPTEQP
jgi:hypothetical protein